MKDIFEAIFESAPDAMIITDLEGRIVNVNLQALKLFGYNYDELIGKKVNVLIPPALADQHQKHVTDYRRAPKTRAMGKGLVLKAIKKDGSEFNAEISLSPISKDNPVFISAAIRDVTEKIQLLNKLQMSEAQLGEQNERLKNFAYIVSHNLRSYAGNMKTMLDLYEDADVLHKPEIMMHLKKTAGSLGETIKDLDKIISIHSPHQHQLEKVNIKRCIAKIKDVLSFEIEKYQVIINEHVSCKIEIDYIPAYLESIIFNLLSNSIKYRHRERRPIITIKSICENGKLILEFKDNGQGIDLGKYREKIFGMYQTFHVHDEAKGLGLFITRRQVEAMGGKIEVESVPGEGTTFRIYFF